MSNVPTVSAQDEGNDVICVTIRLSARFAATADLSDRAFIGDVVVKAARDLAATDENVTDGQRNVDDIRKAMQAAKASPGRVVSVDEDIA